MLVSVGWIDSLETRANISNIGIPIGWVSVDENVAWGWDGNSRDVLDEGCEGDSWLAEAVDKLQCTLVLGWDESSWSNLKGLHINPMGLDVRHNIYIFKSVYV